MELNELDRHVLIHTLTGSNPNGAAYRNYYAAGAKHHAASSLKKLCDAGLMRKSGEIPGGYGLYYNCTEAGAAAVGLSLPDEA